MSLTSDSELRLSKLLAYLLRHRPDSVGLSLDPHGWVEIDPLIAAINEHQRVPFTLLRADLVTLVSGASAELFELSEGRIRARSGHSLEVAIEGSDVPDYLFLSLEPDAFEVCQGAQSLCPPDGKPFVLDDDEEQVGEQHLVVVEAARAARTGVVFEPLEEPGQYRCERIPLRYVFSHRAGYKRQVSAGGVLVRRRGEEVEFALIRTLPRDQTQPEPEQPPPPEPPAEPSAQDPEEGGDVADPRERRDRREGTDRRRSDQGAPDGRERRRGRSRRLRRRRRSGRWSAEGRLELPKGKLEQGETAAQAAVREAREEMGITHAVEVRGVLSKNHYTFRTPDGSCVFKTVHYFLLHCAEDEIDFEPRREEGIVSVEWWAGQRAIAQVAFPNLKPVLERAWEITLAS